MKHNGIFGWALAALLLTGCSSGGDEPALQPTPPTSPVESPVLTVEEEVILGAEGGEASVAYAVENPIEGALCDAECEAAWLYDFRFEEAVISFVVDPYDVEAGSEAREATVVVTYPEAESVSFRVRQEADQLLTGIFTLTITRLYPDEVNYTLTVTDPQLTYLIGKTTQKALDEAGGARAVVQQEVQQHLWSENGLEVALKQGDITDGYFMFYADDLQEENFLYLVGVTAEGKITTEVILEALALPDIPVLQLDQPSVEALSEGGVVTLGYTIQNPIEGEALSVTSKPEDPWVKVESVADGVISLHCEPNPNNVERTAEIRLSYRSMPMQTILLKQAPNIEEEPLTFELEVVESHWNRVVVNCTPSDPTA
ncbi:MAG: BACON domain-containing protein, partial [Alistipes sp.]|nr:BACON domain-containing protein [Alistipes sp.]